MRLFHEKDMSEMSQDELLQTGIRDIFLGVGAFVIGVIILGYAIIGILTGLPLSSLLS